MKAFASLSKLCFSLIFTLFLMLCSSVAYGSRADVEAFVTRFYQQCLSRDPDPQGLVDWTNSLIDGTNTGADVANGFIFSQEFTNRNTTNEAFVTILYRAFFDREPDIGGYNGWVNALYSGHDREFVLDGFLNSQEFENLCNGYGISPHSTNTSSEPSTIFDYPPFNLEKVAYILPLGGMAGAHVTPIDHQYYASYDFSSGNEASVDIDVYSPGDGVVTQIQHMNVAAGDSPFAVDDFRLIIQHTSTISSMYIHIDELSDKLAAFDPGLGGYASVNVEVSAGEVIGRYGGSVDYNIVDEDVVLNFVNPDSYVVEDWKIHCPDPFDYFNEQIKSQLIEKCLRTSDPVGGKIAYDIDGRVAGNWFEEGTNGYAGINPDRYWAGHLSIVYDSIDPDAIIVSIGTFNGTAKQFAVKGNSPDPANISVNDGLVVYELMDFEYYKDGNVWDRTSFVQELEVSNSIDMHGVILLQLIEDRKLKVEIIPGKTANEVNGFTGNSLIYVR